MIRTAIQWIFRGLAILAALLATVQPVLGSFSFFRPGEGVDYAAVHLVVGGILYNLALLLAVLAPFTKLRRRWLLFLGCVVLYVLTHIQLRLGLGSNRDVGLLAYHIPVGVAIFFLWYVVAALGFGMRVERERG